MVTLIIYPKTGEETNIYKYKSGVVLATNGTVDYQDEFKSLNDIRRLSISIESYNPEHHKAIKNSDLGAVIKNLEQFREAGFYVNTNSVLTMINYQDLPEIVQRGVELGIPMARFAMFERIGRGLRYPELALNEEQYKEVLRLYQKAIDCHGDKIILTLGLPVYSWTLRKMENYNHSIGLESMQFAITAEGSVYPCASLINSLDDKWGNIREESLLGIVEKNLGKRSCYKRECDINSCCRILISSK